MKKIIESIRDAFNDQLRRICALLSPEHRLVVILVLLLVGAVMNTYFMFYTIRHWNSPKDRGKPIIEHIEAVKMEDSNYELSEEIENEYNYEKEEFNEETR